MTELHTTVMEIAATLEEMSKRLRRVEVLSRTALSSSTTFLSLVDTPDTYVGHAGNTVIVNVGVDGVIFSPFSSACVTFVCGAIGWRATGGSVARTLAHENAFMLSPDGNPRGDYAIDLQQLRSADDDVAGSYGSAIYSNEDNSIGGAGGADTDNEWSTIVGSYNDISDNASYCHIIGSFNDIYTDCYDLTVFGFSHDLTEAQYGVYAYDNITVDDALGCFSFGEINELIENIHDYPTYSGSFGAGNIMEGDMFYAFQFGDDNKVHGTGPAGGDSCWVTFQVGYFNYSQNVNMNFIFGGYCKSSLAVGAGYYYDGRMVLGESGAKGPSDGTGYAGGFQQASWFSQADSIGTMPVAWTTSRFEFPIIQESAWGFTAYISSTDPNCANIGHWKIEGLIENAGGVTTLVWSVITNLYRDVVTEEWQAVADDPNDRLIFQFRDTAGPHVVNYQHTQIRLKTEEIGYS